jgi:hypothetical protein
MTGQTGMVIRSTSGIFVAAGRVDIAPAAIGHSAQFEQKSVHKCTLEDATTRIGIHDIAEVG